MKVKVERCYSQNDNYTVWSLALKDKGQTNTYRIRTYTPNWNRKAATEALNLLQVELPHLNRQNYRFAEK